MTNIVLPIFAISFGVACLLIGVVVIVTLFFTRRK
jgi:hypothetical protein